MHTRVITWFMLAVAGCGPKTTAIGVAPMSASSNVYLRDSFDTDPSSYVGRFLPSGVDDLDETNGMPLVCSKHVSWRFIDGGGVHYTESFRVSAAAGAKLGIPVVGSASVAHDASRTARVTYTLTGKMVGEIKDPDAFAACCKDQPDQCSDRYIGEFLQGTGEVSYASASSTSASASGKTATASASGSASSESEWTRAAAFPNPVYFAFKVTPTPYTQAAVAVCPDWVDQPPAAPGRTYAVGSGGPARSEQAARDQAQNNARGAIVRATGLAQDALLGGYPQLHVESWCVTPTLADNGSTKYAAKALAYTTDDAVAAVRVRAEAARKAAAELAAVAAAAAASAPPAPPDAPALAAPSSAGSGDVARVRAAVGAEAFSSDKLQALESAAAGARLTTSDVASILGDFAMSSDKIAALEILADTVVDPANWHVIVAAFTFSGDKELARAIAP